MIIKSTDMIKSYFQNTLQSYYTMISLLRKHMNTLLIETETEMINTATTILPVILIATSPSGKNADGKCWHEDPPGCVQIAAH